MEEILYPALEETNSNPIRTLASVQIVERIDPHPDADKLELATILGWQVVIAKGEAFVGQKIVYCEIDSLLPGNAEWLPVAIQNRVEKQSNKRWFRIKTIKLRGELSQGLIIPMDNLDEVDTDMTATLGVKKYKMKAFGGRYGKAKPAKVYTFPTKYVSQTDEIRIQSRPKLLKYIQDQPYYMTVKLDGTSGTFLINPDTGEFLVCSRNHIRTKPAVIADCPYWTAADVSGLETKLKNCPHLAIQGEICGPNIQKNPLDLDSIQFFVFNIVDIKHRRLLPLHEMKEWCAKLDLTMVPIEEEGNKFDYKTISELLEKAKGDYDSGVIREGLVVRTQNQKISFKAINNDFELKK